MKPKCKGCAGVFGAILPGDVLCEHCREEERVQESIDDSILALLEDEWDQYELAYRLSLLEEGE